EVIARDDDRTAIDTRSAHHAIAGGEFLELAVLVVLRDARDAAYLVERLAIDEPIDPLAHRVAATRVLPLDFVGTAQLVRSRRPAPQLIDLRIQVLRNSSPACHCPRA